MNPYMLSIDGLNAHISSLRAELSRREGKVRDELMRTVMKQLQSGATVRLIDSTTDRRRLWLITSRSGGLVRYKVPLLKQRGKRVAYGYLQRLNPKVCSYRVFAMITSITRNGKVVYRRSDFLRRRKATSLLDKSYPFK